VRTHGVHGGSAWLEPQLAEDRGRLYTATCSADLGDARCKIDLANAAYRGSGTVREQGNTSVACPSIAAVRLFLRDSVVVEFEFLKTRGDNSEPAHNMCFRGSSATNRLTIALA
jgi:hypothetical protein